MLALDRDRPRNRGPAATFVEHALPGKDRVLLEHESDTRSDAGDRFAVHPDRSGRGPFQTGNQRQGGGFPATGGPYHRTEFTWLDRQVEVTQRREYSAARRSEPFRHIRQFNGGCGRAIGSRCRRCHRWSPLQNPVTKESAGVFSGGKASADYSLLSSIGVIPRICRTFSARSRSFCAFCPVDLGPGLPVVFHLQVQCPTRQGQGGDDDAPIGGCGRPCDRLPPGCSGRSWGSWSAHRPSAACWKSGRSARVSTTSSRNGHASPPAPPPICPRWQRRCGPATQARSSARWRRPAA